MHDKIESRLGTELADVRDSHGLVMLAFGPLTVALDSDEAQSLAESLLEAAGEARGYMLANALPGSKPARTVRYAA